MSEELRAAAGRVLAELDGIARAYDHYEYGLPGDAEQQRQMEDVILRAFAPPDDDELVDEAWLRAVGAKESRNGTLAIGPAEWFNFSACDELLIDHHLGNYPLKTRGHVRRLCAALGIALAEQVPAREPD